MAQNMCRFCLGQSDLQEISKSLRFKIDVLLNIKIKEDDKRTSACGDCRCKIMEFFDFRSLCNRAEEKFGNNSTEKVNGDALIKIKTEPCDSENMVTVKEEPLDFDQAPPAKPRIMSLGPLGPNGLAYPANGLVYPPFYAVDHTGALVQMPAMVPLGSPIPISSIHSAGFAHMPTVGSLPLAMSAPSSLKEISSTTSDADSPSTVQKEAKTPRKKAMGEKIQKEESEVHPSTTQDDTNIPPNVQSADPESESSVDDIINEVHTDNEDDSSEAKGVKTAEDKNKEEDGSKKSEGNNDMSQESLKTPVESEGQSRDSDVNKDTPPFSRSTKGRKRRSSSIPSRSSAKRLRNRRSENTPKTPEKDQTESLSSRRLTRSSTGAKTRQIRKIVDSDSDDGDFNPDDPDDPDDPEYSTSKKRLSSSSSSNESDTEENSEGKNSKEKTPNAKTPQEKSEGKKESVPLAVILNRSRIQKEESLMKSCPHCKLTYKHWVSYDDHVKTCEEQKKLEKEKLAKEGPKTVEKEVDDKKEVKCIVCLNKFVGTKNLREHMQVHQPKKGPPFQCKTCQENFPDKGGLICHNALKHRANITEPIMKSERKKLHCVDCDEHFQNSGDYICHQVLYHKKK